MNKQQPVPFPLLDRPTHYLAALEDTVRLDCTHVAIKLVPSTLIRLVWMHLVASALRLVGIKSAVFETRVRTLPIACLKYQGELLLNPNDETSSDEAPYDCLSLGELANLGGYATDGVLDTYFLRAMNNTKIYVVEVHAERFAMRLKIYFFGQILSLETNYFNLDVIVEDFLKRSVRHFLTRNSSAGEE